MHPIILAYPAGINHMGEVVFAVGEYKIGVRHCVVAVCPSRFGSRRNARGPLNRLDGPIGSGEADKTSIEEIEPHLEIVEAQRRLKFDYGKFDYVIHDGQPVLLDANKTTGADRIRSPELNARRRHRANGIYSYFL